MKILIIIVVVVIIFAISSSKKNNGSAQKNVQRTGKSNLSQNNTQKYSLAVNSPQPYSSVLCSLQRIVESVAKATYCEIGVVVQVHKIDDTYCGVVCQLLADTSFRNVSFGEGFMFNGDDLASFETKIATGFTTLDDVKREILLQFNWSDVSVWNDNVTVLPNAVNGPFASYSFTMKG